MKFSKALRHIDMKDVKNKRLQKESARIKEEKKKEDTKKIYCICNGAGQI